NRNEAARVVEVLRRQVREHPERSIGVVAFGSNQRDRILEQIKDARELDSTLDDYCRAEGAEPFFVKALEEVQGDERDTMIVSVGFARNREGKLSHNFGPINQDGGERRLNVLFTRAREQHILVSSIRAIDIEEARASKLGPRLLKNYLDYAERGPKALDEFVHSVGDETESPFEEEVARALERAGWTVHTQVGVSKYRIDLAVVDPEHPGRYLLAIECDGATYHSLKTARDRDRLRQDVLEGLGWEFHRVWSTEWMKNPVRELARIEARLAALMATDRIGEKISKQVEIIPLPEPEPVEPERSAQNPIRDLPKLEPYRIADVPVVMHGRLQEAPLSALAQAVTVVVQTEGPIQEEVLIRRISAAWGHARSGSKIMERMRAAIHEAERMGEVHRSGTFLRASNGEDPVPRGAAADGWLREIGQIAPEERLAAMRMVLELSLSLPTDELIQQTARLLGYARTGSDITQELRATVDQGLSSGAFEKFSDRVRLVR
ncbi:MAG: DUF3320 domain-containing protein, partial [Thermomicrobiales bacterium]